MDVNLISKTYIVIYIIIPIVMGIKYINYTILNYKHHKLKLELFKSTYYIILALFMILNFLTNEGEQVVYKYTLAITILEGIFGVGNYIEKNKEVNNNSKKEYWKNRS